MNRAAARQLTVALNLHAYPDAGAQARMLACATADRLRAGIAARGAASLVVPGGRTPTGFLRELADAALDWQRVQVTLTDERWVDAAFPDSNEKQVRDNLLHGPARQATFVYLKTAHEDPRAALFARTRALLAMARPFDAVVLGMGEDGHVGSLFPGAACLPKAMNPDEDPALVAISPPRAPHRRISFNLPALLDARHIAILVQGKTKLEVLERAAADCTPALELPVAAIVTQRRAPVEIHWTQ